MSTGNTVSTLATQDIGISTKPVCELVGYDLEWSNIVPEQRAARANAKQCLFCGLQDGSSRGDAVYLQSVTSSGSWAKLVPSFGARVNYRRLRLGLLEGTAKMVVSRVPGSTEAICKTVTVGARAFECPAGPGVEETGSHVVLDCPQRQHVRATACAKAANAVGVTGTPAAAEWSALGLAGQTAHHGKLTGAQDF